MFDPVPKTPDFPALEKDILSFWRERQIFTQRVEQNRGSGAKYRFYDGPITANNPMGVHHAWGRSLKDLYQRYHAMLGEEQRFQNGFDCQGLWLEVEVEKALALDSKNAIVGYGLECFSRECRQRVEKFSGVQTEQSIRLGQWMDWDHSYYTMSDTNIEYIWHFLRTCHERGWLVRSVKPMPWCARCGCSLSQHETADAYQEIEHEAVYFKLPVEGEPSTYFLVWTTTPWTLSANVALAVHPDLDYVKARQGDDVLVLSAGTAGRLRGPHEVVGTVKGRDLVGKRYRGPLHIPAREKADRVVIPWDAVSETEGTGIVHIAPGCGAEDFELSRRHGLAVIAPVDDAGNYVDPAFAELAGKSAFEVAPLVFEHLERHGHLYARERYAHRYPHCWRCKKELLFRLVEEWFISCEEVRPRMIDAARTVRWIPDYIGKRMEDWLRNMGDWCISRKRFWGLPLPFYKCGCGELTVVGSRSELAERAAGRLPELPELHRPWIDEVRIRCPKCSATVERIPEVGDCWLDAGIIPFSTLKYLEDPPYWREWFPAHMVCEMREQVRLWFYSLLFMSVTLEGKAPYETVLTYESVVDEEGARFSKTKGNAVWFDVAVEKIGADVMRWMYAAQPITSNLRFGEGPAQEVARKLLTFWNVYAFFVTYASLDRPDLSRPVDPHAAGLLDRWILARTDLLVRAARGRLDDYDTPAFVREAERFFDDLSNWYVRRSRRRFWKSGGDDAAAAYSTLYEVLLVTVRLLAPVVPFLAEHIWTNLTRARPGLPESVHLADYPAPDGAWRDDRLVADMATAQRLAALGLAARNEAGIKVRRPLSRMLARVEDSAERAACERLTSVVADEVNVKGIKFEDDLSGFLSYEVKPDFKALGPRLGSAVKEVAAALKSADSGALGPRVERGETIEVDTVSGPVRLAPPELVLKRGYRPGFAGAADRTLAVVLDTRIDHALLLEGLAREVVRLVQNMRKEAGFAVSDRIHAAWKAEGEVALAIQNHRDFIARETLSLALEPADEPRGDRVERFDLDGQPVTIAVRRT